MLSLFNVTFPVSDTIIALLALKAGPPIIKSPSVWRAPLRLSPLLSSSLLLILTAPLTLLPIFSSSSAELILSKSEKYFSSIASKRIGVLILVFSVTLPLTFIFAVDILLPPLTLPFRQPAPVSMINESLSLDIAVIVLLNGSSVSPWDANATLVCIHIVTIIVAISNIDKIFFFNFSFPLWYFWSLNLKQKRLHQEIF